jgi:hypothetical protein
MAAEGHFDPFSPPRLNGRCPFSQPTSAGASGKRKVRRNQPFTGPAGGGSFAESIWSLPIDNLCWSALVTV